MISKNLFEQRQSKFNELTELSTENFLSESTASKVKNRKLNIFQKMMSFRNNLLLKSKSKNKKSLNTSNFRDILNLITNNEDKINLINYLFLNDILKFKEIILKYPNFKFIIDYNLLSTSHYLLEVIETQNEVLKILIENKNNISYLINKINLMSNEKIPYDRNYIMICSYFYISDENVDKILKQELNHYKIIDLIIKNETTISYIYLFYIYAYIYHLNNQQIGQNEKILDSLLLILVDKKNCNNDNLLWEIYDLLTFFSQIPKFVYKFYDKYEYIFAKREFYEKDKITIEKLKIINNIFNNLNGDGIKYFLQKDNGSILNLILFSLKILSSMISNNNISNNNVKYKLFSESIKILLKLSSYKDLTYLLLENKKCVYLIIDTFKSFVSSHLQINNLLLNEMCSNIYQIVNNIIIYEHRKFISLFKYNNLHLKINSKFEFYANSNYFESNHFISLINIIQCLFEDEKKNNFNQDSIKLDLDNNNFYNIIMKILLKYNSDDIHNTLIKFIGIYYPNNQQNNNL